MHFLSFRPFPKRKIKCGVSLCEWDCVIAGNNAILPTACSVVQLAGVVKGKVPSFTGYSLIPCDVF